MRKECEDLKLCLQNNPDCSFYSWQWDEVLQSAMLIRDGGLWTSIRRKPSSSTSLILLCWIRYDANFFCHLVSKSTTCLSPSMPSLGSSRFCKYVQDLYVKLQIIKLKTFFGQTKYKLHNLCKGHRKLLEL